ncbi:MULTISPECIES: hexokinase [Sphaerochaeta]|jgi:hexokinase|uniref:Hexokinase n=1 Tax=Sphaerochaeta associata TaxID=1129264 RepID=A0ABY4D7A4_9SPIR|nr:MULTISPECIES: hexokinase [Sphaerochaeta]MDD3423251.1 hexokinase [Sphaerochaeta sp.]MDD3455517.1 hexokinase [Sphaerochaeta sp.]MDD4037242.1 hexokinase [Sphaerochaeta sp.]MDD4449162.1 hexokinase [Sphaerochaeta sp.]MEA5027498.1 hexokinase [Sphaerochaeta associata]
MSDCVQNTTAFLSKWGIEAASIDMKSLLATFLSEMEKGLENESGSSLKMIPTYTEVVSGLAKGEPVIVLDAGGTNFRTCLVTFDEQGLAHIEDFRKVSMPGVKEEVTAQQFFSTFADEVERLIDKSDKIGFCFSYAAAITEDHDGIPLVFSKEIKAPEVIGKKVGASLLSELARRGYDVSKKKVAVLNDTVATLLAGQGAPSDTDYSGYIGFILGTGTNTAYVERNSNISKLGLFDGKSQIINIESGNFDFCPGRLDREYFDSTKHPEQYHLEKMISGAYLGPLSTLVIQKAIAEGVLSSTFAKRFAQLGTVNTTVMSNYLEMPFNSNYALVACCEGNEDDAIALWMIIDAVIARAAKLTAANLAATVIKSGAGTDPRKPVCINADGTTFYKTEYLKKYTEYYLHTYLQLEHKRYYRFVRIDDSPTIGAAIAGLSL